MTTDTTQARHTAAAADSLPTGDQGVRLRAAHRRTALILAGIAIVFFVGIMATRFMGGPVTGIGILGSAVLLFLVVAIGRNLRDKQ